MFYQDDDEQVASLMTSEVWCCLLGNASALVLRKLNDRDENGEDVYERIGFSPSISCKGWDTISRQQIMII